MEKKKGKLEKTKELYFMERKNMYRRSVVGCATSDLCLQLMKMNIVYIHKKGKEKKLAGLGEILQQV